MTAAALVARLVLGAVFVASGTTKATPDGRRAFAVALRGFGVGRGRRLVERSLPAVEIVLGALLLSGVAVRVVAGVGLTLLALFTAVLIRSLADGREVECGCFGRASGEPAGWPTVARNVALVGAAAVAATEPLLVAPWGPADRAIPAALIAAGVLTAAALVAQLDRLRRWRPTT